MFNVAFGFCSSSATTYKSRSLLEQTPTSHPSHKLDATENSCETSW